jgi:hypothetical protein
LIGGALAAMSFVFLFTFDALTSLCYFILILLRLREPARHLVSAGSRHSPLAAFSDRRMLLLFFCYPFSLLNFSRHISLCLWLCGCME